jgi:hypothetical protein
MRVALRLGERERQRFDERVRERVLVGKLRRRFRTAFAVGDAHRELLREELVELEAAPCGMRSFLEARGVDLRRRPVEEKDALAEGLSLSFRRNASSSVSSSGHRIQGALDQLAQLCLRKARGRGIDRRERLRQRRALLHDAVARVDHLVAEEARAHLAEEAHALALRELFHLARIEVEETNPQVALAVRELHDERAPRPVLHLRIHDLRFDEDRHASLRVLERRELRLVLVARRQVQHQIELRADAQLLEARADGRGDGGRGCGCHG